jgi:hypothetical protein
MRNKCRVSKEKRFFLAPQARAQSSGARWKKRSTTKTSFLQVAYQLLELFLILVVVLPLREIRNVVFADLAG